MQELLILYFDNLLKASNTEWKSIVEYMHSIVIVEHNSYFLKPVKHREIKNALFHMHLDKSLRPDGVSPGFYQKHWHVLGNDITKVIQQIFDTGTFEDKLIDTNIFLVPKKLNLMSIGDLRPISLYNVIYKLVYKVIVNRLKEVIRLVISKD